MNAAFRRPLYRFAALLHRFPSCFGCKPIRPIFFPLLRHVDSQAVLLCGGVGAFDRSIPRIATEVEHAPMHGHEDGGVDVQHALHGLFGEHMGVRPACVGGVDFSKGDVEAAVFLPDGGEMFVVARVAAPIQPFACAFDYIRCPQGFARSLRPRRE